MPRPSSKTPSSTSQSRRASPSPTPSPATAPRPKNPGAAAQRRRSPLSDLNSGDASAARAGCFRFLLSSASGSKPRCASTPRTPASGPMPRAEAKRLVAGAGRLPDQESRARAEQGPGREPRRRRDEPIGCRIRRVEPEKKQQGLARRQQQEHLEALTPERKADAGSNPSSGATPPIHASISPEVLAGGAATPACFAAGHHVVPGVRDRRKCRARGILDIAGEGTSEELDCEPSRASIHWLSSPSGEAGTCSTKCGKEASVIWLSSPRDEGAACLFDEEIFLPRCSSEDPFWQLSPDCTGLLGSPVLGGLLDFDTPASELSETTPSSGFLPVQRTPSTGDSISPFSLIVKRASSHSSRLSSLCAQRGLGSSYGYDSATDPTRVSGESWSENGSTGKCSGLARVSSRPLTRMDPVVECLEMMSLSPRPGDADYDQNDEDGALPATLPELSFQFAGASTPLESIDLSSFKRSPCDTELKGKEASFRKPASTEARISWREGLVSRIFDMGDLDCCQWLSDDEDGPLIPGNVEALPDTTLQPVNACCLQEDSKQSGFGSVEFGCSGGGLNYDSSKATPSPVQVAESMRAEGFELVSSDDSDWTLLYKNGLFET
ncbi:hypothetical protein CFC21_060820 [Triticum aestivum]|uniref:Uncharacterized protein n=2 Tax=Triticum aestivum TaxID=4565 RepID=A0A9R1KG20_WHEAT|nr:uncharacterized protein LOC123096191 [Triticum aestivum]KAF7052764.1 hypothetical protein CFC21_060820 [Triticum aestivum]